MSKWRKKQLQEIAFLKPTETLKKGDIAPNIPMANIKEFQRDVVKIDYGEFRGGTKFRNGDTLLAKITPCLENGKTAFVNCLQEDEIGFGSTEFIVLRAKENIDERFLYYLSISPEFRKQAISLMEGTSGRKRVNENALKISDFLIPDFEEQKKIANILSAIDDKISLNNQINQELEAMAKILYDYWFVQFDFPDQNGNPYKSSGGKMVYHPELKREIPEGWGVEDLKDFESKIITGKTPSRANSDNFGGEIPFITIGDIRGNTFIYRTSESLTDLGANVQQNKYLPEGSLCVSCIATVGEIGFTTEWSHTNQQINSIVFEDETNRYYLYFALKNYFENANASAKTGNTFANMNKEDFSGIRIILPSKEIKNNFHEISEPYFAQIKCLQGQNQELIQFRDWLLPMLMNGQVKVEDFII